MAAVELFLCGIATLLLCSRRPWSAFEISNSPRVGDFIFSSHLRWQMRLIGRDAEAIYPVFVFVQSLENHYSLVYLESTKLRCECSLQK